jgi:flagellar assembly protein FliH
VALVKQSLAANIAKDALVLDLGDLQRQGYAIVEAARRQAAQVVQEAHATRAKLISDAQEVGFQQGLAKGHAEGMIKGEALGITQSIAANKIVLDQLAAGWSSALKQYDIDRAQMHAQAQRDVIALAALIASRVVKRTVQLNPDLVKDQVEQVLAMVLRHTRITLAVNSEDQPIVQAALPTILATVATCREVDLTADDSLARGSCVARLADSGALIDASIDTQLERIIQALLPMGSADASHDQPSASGGES